MNEPVGRYALPEYERRFLLDAIPNDADRMRTITDRFVRGTRLRLRTVTHPVTGEVLHRKVGHKVRPDAGDPTIVMHTSLYVSAEEIAVLAELDAVEVTKHRYRWSHDLHQAAVDAYSGPLRGLVIAELNFPDHASLLQYEPSPPLGAEVTGIPQLIGPELGGLTSEHLADRIGALHGHTQHTPFDES